MNVYIPLAIFLVLLCLWGRQYERSANVTFWIAMIVTCVFALFRYEFGPDYFNYHEIYDGIQGADIENYIGRGMFVEKPFLYFLQFFPKFTSFFS